MFMSTIRCTFGGLHVRLTARGRSWLQLPKSCVGSLRELRLPLAVQREEHRAELSVTGFGGKWKKQKKVRAQL